jgi:hypothetical protein
MSEFKKFPKGNVRRNHNFYGWTLLAVMFVLMGSIIIAKGKFYNRAGTLVCEGKPAILLGIIFICFGL